MGKYSHYCNISKITITANQKCVLIPLRKSNTLNTIGYLSYVPATLPIFGTYTGYGSLEDIEEDDNTKLIEQYYSKKLKYYKIDEITEYIMRMGIETNCNHTQNLIDDGIVSFMLVDRQVYDSLSKINYSEEWDFRLGEEGLLKELGFTFIEENSNARYNQVWELNEKIILSDGRWIELPDSSGIYDLKGLIEYANVDKTKHYLLDKNSSQIWNLYSDEVLLDFHLVWVLGRNKFFSEMQYNKLLNRLDKETSLTRLTKQHNEILNSLDENDIGFKEYRLKHIKEQIYNLNSLSTLYCENIKQYGDRIAELCTLYFNMKCFSTTFQPQDILQSPQYGKYQSHSKMLQLFVDINNSYINTQVDD